MPETNLDPFPLLPGLDIEAGLKVVRNNGQLYKKLLLKFSDSYAGFEQQFLDAEQQLDEDPEAAKRCAHTLKGVASNLGMLVLSESAYQLQLACEQADGSKDQKLADVVLELNKVVAGVETLRD